jgi:CheY-like chemotaxis protein
MPTTSKLPTSDRKLASFGSPSAIESGQFSEIDFIWDEEPQFVAGGGFSQFISKFDETTDHLDVITLDVQLPALSGLDQVALLKKKNPTSPVLIMSSGNTAEVMSRVVALRRPVHRSVSPATALNVQGSSVPSISAQTSVESTVTGLLLTAPQRQTSFAQLLQTLDSSDAAFLGNDSMHFETGVFQSLTETLRTRLKQVIQNQSWQPDVTTKVAYRLSQISEMVRAPDSILPSQKLIDAAIQVVGYLPATTRLPQIEIDDSNGAISLVWRDLADQNTFSLEIPNPRHVVGVGFGRNFPKFKPWRYLISDERRIIGAIESSETAKKLLSNA